MVYSRRLLFITVSVLLSHAVAQAQDTSPEDAVPTANGGANVPGTAPNSADSARVPPELSVEITAEPESVRLGQEIQLQVKVVHPTAVRILFPAQPAVEPFRVVAPARAPTTEGVGDLVTETWTFTVAPMRLGRRRLPPFEIDYEMASGQLSSVSTEPVAVTVEASIDSESLKSTTPTVGTPFQLFDTNWFLIVALVLLGVVVVTAVVTTVAVRYVARLPKRGPPPPPPRPAHEVAEARLAALISEQLVAKGERKAYVFRVSEILREYLGLRYAMNTLEQTSSELLADMRALGPAGLSVYELEGFLGSTDLIKFAGQSPTDSDCSQATETTTTMIQKTRRSDEELDSLRAREEMRRRLEKPAHPFKRIYAILLDLVFYSVVSSGLVIAASMFELGWLHWVNGAFFGLFLLFRDIAGNGSPGKMLSGLALTPPKSTQSELLPATARLGRNLTLLLPVVGHTMELVVMIYAADGRRVGDRWAGSRVLDRKPESSEAPYLLGALALSVALLLIGYVVPFVLVGG